MFLSQVHKAGLPPSVCSSSHSRHTPVDRQWRVCLSRGVKLRLQITSRFLLHFFVDVTERLQYASSFFSVPSLPLALQSRTRGVSVGVRFLLALNNTYVGLFLPSQFTDDPIDVAQVVEHERYWAGVLIDPGATSRLKVLSTADASYDEALAETIHGNEAHNEIASRRSVCYIHLTECVPPL